MYMGRQSQGEVSEDEESHTWSTGDHFGGVHAMGEAAGDHGEAEKNAQWPLSGSHETLARPLWGLAVKVSPGSRLGGSSGFALFWPTTLSLLSPSGSVTVLGRAGRRDGPGLHVGFRKRGASASGC